MTPDAALEQAASATLRPFYLVVGTERYLRDRVVNALREAALAGAVVAFNEDRFIAGEKSVDEVLAAARLVPMMAERRFVLVRQTERWDSKADGESPLDRLAGYADAPVDSTVVVAVAESLDGRRRLMQLAKKKDLLVSCEPLREAELGRFVRQEAQNRGHGIDGEVASLIAALVGPDLAQIVDAVERLSLFVGPGKALDADAVATCITRLRVEDSWALVDAIRARQTGQALAILHRVYDARDRGLPLLGALAWSVRQLTKLHGALSEGVPVEEAARKAGIFHPGRARELAGSLRGMPTARFERLLSTLAETDRALKGSKRPPLLVLEAAILELCR